MKKTTKKLIRELVGGEPYEYYSVGRHIIRERKITRESRSLVGGHHEILRTGGERTRLA